MTTNMQHDGRHYLSCDVRIIGTHVPCTCTQLEHIQDAVNGSAYLRAGTIGAERALEIELHGTGGSLRPSESDVEDNITRYLDKPVCPKCWQVLPASGKCGSFSHD
jgi:hypothetical protein